MGVPVRSLRILVVLGSMTYLVATAWIMSVTDVATSYAATSAWLGRATLAAGAALMVAGLFVWFGGRRGTVGQAMLALGVVWLGGEWVAWADGPDAIRSVAAIALPMLAPLLLHLALALPDGDLSRRPRKACLAVVYGLTAGLSLVHAFVYDPVLDLGCWRTCTANVFLARADPGLADALARVQSLATLVLALAVVALCAARVAGIGTAAASPAAMRSAGLTLVPVGVAGGFLGIQAALLALRPVEDPIDREFALAYAGLALALLAVALVTGWTEFLVMLVYRRVSRLASDLAGAAAGSLQEVLRTTVGDPSLTVAYPLADAETYVDSKGIVVQPCLGAGRATATIVRGGKLVALVTHDQGVASAATLAREIGAGARLAVDNERLAAQILSQVMALQASRARVVAASDEARRGIERDLHDGAQQRLLVLTYDLRLARSAAEASGDLRAAAALATACDQARAALVELRELAHGIYPAILAEAGLSSALQTLVDEATIPVVLEVSPDDVPNAAARAAYAVVCDAVADATRLGCSRVAVSIGSQGGVVRVSVSGVGLGRALGPVDGAAVRVEALGGHLEVQDGRLIAEIPCA